MERCWSSCRRDCASFNFEQAFSLALLTPIAWIMPEISLQEEHLLIRIVRSRESGHEEAASTLFDRLSGYVLAMIQTTGNLQNDDLNEVAQKVWLRVFKRDADEHFESAAEFRGWLKKVAVSRAIDELRRTARTRKREIAVQGDFSEVMNQEDPRADALGRCMEKLEESSADYAAVVKSMCAGIPGEQIARSLNIKQNTVYSRFNRGKEVLKDCIDRSLVK